MSTNCPSCGSPGKIACLEIMDLYRCSNWKCREEYHVTRNTCQSCGDWIEDDQAYCSAHGGSHGEPRTNFRTCTQCDNYTTDEDNPYCALHTEALVPDEEPVSVPEEPSEYHRAIKTPGFFRKIGFAAPRIPHAPVIGQGQDRPSRHDPPCNDCDGPQVPAREPSTLYEEDGTVYEPHESLPHHESNAWECENNDCPPSIVPQQHYEKEYYEEPPDA